ncbi:MAG: hypothetical protein V3U35_03550 [Candidatus Neomarinimicrobiota bacterium]
MSKADEYRHLNEEIKQNSTISQNVFVANVAVTAGLIGYGLDSGKAAIFLAPFAIIVPSLFFLASQLESTTRIAAYIAVFLEGDNPSLNWETRWFHLRRDGLLPSRRKYTPSLSGLYGLISVVCILLARQYWIEPWWWFLIAVIPIALLVGLGVRSLLRAFAMDFIEEYVNAWENLKSSESGDAA